MDERSLLTLKGCIQEVGVQSTPYRADPLLCTLNTYGSREPGPPVSGDRGDAFDRLPSGLSLRVEDRPGNPSARQEAGHNSGQHPLSHRSGRGGGAPRWTCGRRAYNPTRAFVSPASYIVCSIMAEPFVEGL